MKKLLSFVFALFTGLSINLAAQENQTVNQVQPIIVIETNLGVIEAKLFSDAAPKTCENFMGLIQKKYYDGTVFHRIIKKFMIQGGDPTGTGAGGESIWGKAFADECSANLKFDRPGLLAMANRGPNTNGSQFFITTVSTPWLNMKHTIFGEVVKGYDIVQKMESAKTDVRDRPVEPIKIIKAYVRS
jgi:peptidylprolyl isomerase